MKASRLRAEDSEEFLTILGKKMGKLVKGGDAEPKLCVEANGSDPR